jgi:hypothetical protein
METPDFLYVLPPANFPSLSNVLFPLLPISLPGRHFRNCDQRIDSQQYSPFSKQLVTRCRAGHCPHLGNVRVRYRW